LNGTSHELKISGGATSVLSSLVLISVVTQPRHPIFFFFRARPK
jgi:hypothetical protein